MGGQNLGVRGVGCQIPRKKLQKLGCGSVRAVLSMHTAILGSIPSREVGDVA